MNTTETLQVSGMTCDHCVRAVRKVLSETPGVEVREVAIGAAEISYDPEVTDREMITGALEEEGYAVVEDKG